MRLSIGLKIFGACAALLLLMIALSAASMRLVDQVGDELNIQSAVFLPVNNRIAAIEARILQEEIQLARLLSLHAAAALDEAAVADAEAGVRELDDRLREDLDAARAALAGYEPDDRLDADSRVEMARIAVLLDVIEAEHEDYHDHAMTLLGLLHDGRPEQVELLGTLLAREQTEVHARLDGLRREVAGFVEAALAESAEHEAWLNRLILVLTGGAVALGLVFAGAITRGLVSPVRYLLVGVRAVEAGDLEVEVTVRSRDEVGDLARGFNAMVAGLRAKERITDTFGKYVDPRIVSHLIGSPQLAMPGGDRRTMTVFFSDLVEFTALSERLVPTALVNLLNAYLTEMSEPIRARSGVIDKYIGDAIMAYWGPPFVEAAEQATAACRAALDQRARLPAFRERVPEIIGVRVDVPSIDMRMGLATGPAVVGTIGSTSTRNYTVIGDTVNLASRLEGACRAYRVPILVDRATRDAAAGLVFREIDSLRVKGRDEPVRVFELLPAAPGEEPAAALVAAFEVGLTAYRGRRLDAAEDGFRRCLELAPDDGPSRVFLERIALMRDRPPPEDWDGVWTMTTK